MGQMVGREVLDAGRELLWLALAGIFVFYLLDQRLRLRLLTTPVFEQIEDCHAEIGANLAPLAGLSSSVAAAIRAHHLIPDGRMTGDLDETSALVCTCVTQAEEPPHDGGCDGAQKSRWSPWIAETFSN